MRSGNYRNEAKLTMKILDLEMLPAAEGDALFITYGDSDAPNTILIDGGRRSTYHNLRERILSMPLNSDGRRFFQLLIITHIDADHIEGIICLLQDKELNCEFGDVWFNDWHHMLPLVEGEMPVHLGAKQGEFLGALLNTPEVNWNKAFNSGAVVLPPTPAALPTADFADGLRITIVSPTIASLIDLREKWKSAIEDAGFVPGDRDNALQQFAGMAWAKLPKKHLGDESKKRSMDHSEANGSSIGVLLEYGDVRLLLSGDAHPKILRESMDRWCQEHPEKPDRVWLDAFKVPHHGSKKNITPQLMSSIKCETYLVSTSGTRFHHPDVDAIKMIIDEHSGSTKPEFLFNYKSDDNSFWENQDSCITLYEEDAVLEYDVLD